MSRTPAAAEATGQPPAHSVDWFIPDAYIPPQSTDATSHESLCVLNPSNEEALIRIEALFEGAAPCESGAVTIPARSCVHLRTDDPDRIGGLVIPRGVAYGLIVRSDPTLYIQYSRLDTTQAAYTLMTVNPQRGAYV